jgi:hypothetical protein
MTTDTMTGVMGEIDPRTNIIGQITYLMKLYKERTGRVANIICLNPKTLAEHPLKGGNLVISIRAYQIVQPDILWVGEAS